MKKQSNVVNNKYNLSFSIGFSGTDGINKKERCKLVEEADSNMYAQKKRMACKMFKYSDAME